MRNLLKLVFQRVVAVSFGIALQIIFLIVMATYLRTDFFWIRIAMNVLSWAVVIYIISCGVNPSYKIAWIVLILAFPVAGLTIYLLFGGNRISNRGTALNLMAPALVLFLIRIIANQNTLQMATGDSASWFMLKKSTFGVDKNVDWGFFGETFLNKIYLATYVCILLFIILSVILYKTKFGLRLRACGENPQAADSLGINVYKMRYAGVTISGALAGMGGFVYAMTTANCSSNGDVAGFGFLALAVMIFGNWKPLNIAGASLLFGLFKCIAAAYASIDINGDGVFLLADIGISAHLYRMLPYLITLLVLAFTSKKSRAPKAEGIPYDKGQR